MATLYQEAREALRGADFRPKKKLGQNFLVHENVVDAVLRLLDLNPNDEVVEIGPGLGFVTRRLVERAGKIWAIEVDRFLVERLSEGPLGSHPALELIHDDILKLSLDQRLPARKVKLVGNLPYSISTPVLFRLFEWRERFSCLVLMVQKEVADRMASRPGTKSYGTLSIWCQVHGRIVEKVAVSPEAFFPRPKVRSTILKIILHPQPLIAGDDLVRLRGLVRSAFGQRRKTLGNALGGWLKRSRGEIEAFLRTQGVDPKRRGETLSLEEYIRLAGALKHLPVPDIEH